MNINRDDTSLIKKERKKTSEVPTLTFGYFSKSRMNMFLTLTKNIREIINNHSNTLMMRGELHN